MHLGYLLLDRVEKRLPWVGNVAMLKRERGV